MKTRIRFLEFLLLAAALLAGRPAGAATLEEKIGQLIMVGFEGRDFSELDTRLRQQLSRGEIGGLLFLPRNLGEPDHLRRLVAEIKAQPVPRPLLLAIDQEGGPVGRLNAKRGFRDFPSARRAARELTPAAAGGVYLEMARLLKEIGFNLNLAPVVDLNINPDSPAIGRKERAFAADPATVVRYASAFIRAHRRAGLLTALKHYPGHGSAAEDSHLGLTDVTATWTAAELEPYRRLIRAGLADAVLTAHVIQAGVDPDWPASLSTRHLKENLRGKLGFRGVIITDDLQMGAVSRLYSFEEAVVRALDAGSDILLFANYFTPDREAPARAGRAILAAVRAGRLSPERIDQSYQRVLRFKSRLR